MLRSASLRCGNRRRGCVSMSVVIVLVVAVAFLWWAFRSGRPTFTIHVENHHVDIEGKLPRKGEIAEFFRNDLGPLGRYQVDGDWSPGSRLRLKYHGNLRPGDRQRIRNFLVMMLDGR